MSSPYSRRGLRQSTKPLKRTTPLRRFTPLARTEIARVSDKALEAMGCRPTHMADLEAGRMRKRLVDPRQLPVWQDHLELLELHREVREHRELDGQAWELDHIIPLRGRLVSGLHVTGNLRVIDGARNREKGASFDPDTFEGP